MQGELVHMGGVHTPQNSLDLPFMTAQEFLARNGRFCLSDDSHGIDQVGLNYHRVLDFIERTGISEVHYLEYAPESPSSKLPDARFPNIRVRAISVADLKLEQFWTVGQSKP